MIADEVVVIMVTAAALFTTGVYCLTSRSNVIRMVMGIELLGKGASLLFILGGYLAGDTAISQAVVITLIAIEAVVAGLALALVVRLNRGWKTLDIVAISRIASRGER